MPTCVTTATARPRPRPSHQEGGTSFLSPSVVASYRFVTNDHTLRGLAQHLLMISRSRCGQGYIHFQAPPCCGGIQFCTEAAWSPSQEVTVSSQRLPCSLARGPSSFFKPATVGGVLDTLQISLTFSPSSNSLPHNSAFKRP